MECFRDSPLNIHSFWIWNKTCSRDKRSWYESLVFTPYAKRELVPSSHALLFKVLTNRFNGERLHSSKTRHSHKVRWWRRINRTLKSLLVLIRTIHVSALGFFGHFTRLVRLVLWNTCVVFQLLWKAVRNINPHISIITFANCPYRQSRSVFKKGIEQSDIWLDCWTQELLPDKRPTVSHVTTISGRSVLSISCVIYLFIYF